jgi:DNA invertase Pin-like site-specific DNA recombinase
MIEAVAYLRVSGVNQKKGDGYARQEKTIRDWAKKNRITITKIYKERAQGNTFIRPALSNMLVDLSNQKNSMVLIEKLDRLARDLMIQEQIIFDMQKNSIKLVSVLEGRELSENDPSRKLIRQIMGAFAEYDKTMLVQKLKVARDRKKKLTGKCEGRKSYEETHPEVLAEIKRLRRKPRNGQRLSLKKTAEALNSANFKSQTGLEFTVSILKQINHSKRLTAT